MSFVRVKDLLEMGKKNNACVLAFDAADGNMIKSVIKGAEAAGKPVMVMLYPGMRNIMPLEYSLRQRSITRSGPACRWDCI